MGKKKRVSSSAEDSSSEDSSEDSDSSSSPSDSPSSSSSPEKKPKKDSSQKKKKHKEKKKKKLKKKKSKKAKLKDVEKMSNSDYYSRNAEFRAWIKSNDKIKKSFTDMETAEAKMLFKKFVKKWNEKKLSKEFYRGSTGSASGSGNGEAGKSEFQWGFAQTMDSKTKSEIDAVKKGNEREAATGRKDHTKDKGNDSQPENGASYLSQVVPSPSKEKRDNDGGPKGIGVNIIGPVMPAHIANSKESSSEDEEEAFERKMRDKRFKDYVKTTEEELCPKATGHEAKLEKKAMAREKKRMRDTSPGLSDKVLFGDSSKMGKAIEKRKVERVAKQEVSVALAREKVNAYAEREKAKMEALLEMAKSSKKEGALW